MIYFKLRNTSFLKKKKKKLVFSAGEGIEKRELSYIVAGNVNWYSHYGEQYGGSL